MRVVNHTTSRTPLLRRRGMLQALPLAALAASGPPARAATTDLVLSCDPALAPAMRAAGERFRHRSGVQVRVFPTNPGLLLPQLARSVQNDLIFTQRTLVEAAVRTGLVGAGAVHGLWRNRPVIAVRNEAAGGQVHRIAVSDKTPASDMDGPAIVQSLQLGQREIIGVIDTDEVAFLLCRGEVDAGLLHLTDVRAHPGLMVWRPIPEPLAAPILCTVAVTNLARRPHPAAFVDFLTGPEGISLLQSQGLENSA